MRRAAGFSTALAAGALIAVSVSATASAGNDSDAKRAQATGGNGLARTALAAVADHRAALGVGTGQQFRVTDTIVDPNGSTHVRMDRTYRGLPVLGGDMVVHQAADGSYEGASRTLTEAPTMSISTRVG